VEGGVTWAELNRETQAHGLAVTGGVVSSTGVAGLTLGGGLGWLMSKHGLALDNLRSIELVTASGERVRASADEQPDLFWALRGGGGNFGVAASFEFQLHPVGPAVTGGGSSTRFNPLATFSGFSGTPRTRCRTNKRSSEDWSMLPTGPAPSCRPW
jgi:FAD/FMN-containing dehydrogenase